MEKFKRIKDLKERGLQLKAIKMLMVAGRLEAFDRGDYELEEERGMAIEILEVRDAGELAGGATKPDVKAERAVTEGEKAERAATMGKPIEKELVTEEKIERERGTEEKVVKEVVREEVAGEEIFEEEIMPRRDEMYFKKIDQLLRDKCFSPKKKRHFIF